MKTTLKTLREAINAIKSNGASLSNDFSTLLDKIEYPFDIKC